MPVTSARQKLATTSPSKAKRAKDSTYTVLMSTRFQDMWEMAVARYLAGLDDDQRRGVSAVTSPDVLMSHLYRLQIGYRQKTTAYVDRVMPLLDWLKGFNSCVQSFLQASPASFVILWGSLSLLFEVAARYARGLDQLLDVLELIPMSLSRFRAYVQHQLAEGEHDRLGQCLICYFTELLRICHEALCFFRSSFLGNLIGFFFEPLKIRLAPRIQALRNLADNIDTEASFTWDLKQRERHEKQHAELIDSLKSYRQSKAHSDKMLVDASPSTTLPGPRNPNFFGREVELNKLADLLSPGTAPSKCSSAALHGLAGSGKTQVALEFAYRHLQDYDFILWVSAESRMKLAESFNTLARDIGPPHALVTGQLPSAEQQKQAVLRWLEIISCQAGNGHPVRWLLVFDNVQDLNLIEPYLPTPKSKGAVLITCRSSEIATRSSTHRHAAIKLGPFSNTAASAFLISLIDDDGAKQDQVAAAEICESVGNLPLALDIVGSYLRRCRKSMSNFLRDNPGFEKDLLFRTEIERQRLSTYQNSINNAWTAHLSLEVSEGGLDKSSKTLLRMLAFLDADGAPLSIFGRHRMVDMLLDGPDLLETFPNLSNILENPFDDPVILDISVSALLDSSLINLDNKGGHVKCHRLVRIAVARSMTPELKTTTFNRLVFFLNSQFPAQINGQPLYSRWQECENLASSVHALLSSYEDHTTEIDPPILLCEVACRCSWYLFETGQFRTALWMADQCVSICELALETRNHYGFSEWFVKDMISHHINLKATIGREAPSPDHGLGLSEQVLQIRRENMRPGVLEDQTWIAAAEGNLAVSLIAMGKAEEALEILERLVKRDDMHSNKDIYLRNLSLCLIRLHRFDEALATSDLAQAAVDKLEGDMAPQRASVLFDQSTIYSAFEDASNALEAITKCLKIYQSEMPHHRNTGLALHRAGAILEKNGSLTTAITFYEQAFETLANCECHPGAICRTLFALSGAVQQVGNSNDGAKLKKMAEGYKRKIQDTSADDLGARPDDYNRFVTVGLV